MALDNHALPSGGVVTGGSASFDYSNPGQLHVHQGTDRAVIDWDSFNIGRDALTEFHQPSASSLVVNRVTGNGDPTQILGALRANGNVMVLDRNGVIFGQNSRVDVGGIIVSTGDVNTARVMNGDATLQISGANTGGEIVNYGSISVAEAGLAGFVAPTIRNSGVIEARMGRVVLASGAAATLDLYGDGLIEVAVDQKIQNALIDNSGTINAQGGTVLMTASAAKEVVNTVINTSGIINASSATVKGGKIILEGANTKVSGTLDASGKTGGGEILVGGDYLGGGTVKTANSTEITDTAVIKANTTGVDGDGGKVVVWADDSTLFHGAIEAKGGSLSGNGGFVETSGKINLGVTGSVDASALNGAAGQWLLDPQNVRITDGGANSVPIGGGPYDPSGATDPFTISAASISAALSAGNNVLITTTNAGQMQAGHITVTGATILKNGGNSTTLTLKADGDITIDGSSSIRSLGNALGLILWAGANNGGNAQVSITGGAQIETNGGEVFIGGGADDGNDINDAMGNMLYNGVAGDGRPDYFVTSLNSHGVNIQGSAQITTGAGAFTALGKGGVAGTSWGFGIRVNTATITSSGGNILLLGEGGSSTTQTAHGVALETSGMVRSTTTGTITISGRGGAGSGSVGVSVNDGTIEGRDGAITITGRGGTGGTTHTGVLINGNITSLGGSPITITGQRGAAGIDLNILSNFVVGGADATGDQTIIVDSMSASASSMFRTAGAITVKPRSVGNNISLGGASGGLVINDAVLARFFPGTKLVIGDVTGVAGDITAESLDFLGTTYAIELHGNDITFQDTAGAAGYGLRLGSGNFMAHARDNDPTDQGELTVNAAILKSAAGTSLLDLRADQSVLLTNAPITASSGALNVVLNADRDADNDGYIRVQSSHITTNGGYVVAGGGNGTVDSDGNGILGDGGTGADNVAAWGNATRRAGIEFDASNVTTLGGAITMKGHGLLNSTLENVEYSAQGVRLYNSDFTTTSGAITLHGTSSGSGSAGFGIGVFIRANSDVISGSGAINITGIGGGGSGTQNIGVALSSNGVNTVRTTTGSIIINGTKGGGSAYDVALLSNGGSIQSLGSGTIEIKGAGLETFNNMTIGGANATGDIKLNVDSISLGTGNSIRSSGKISVIPRTNNRAIYLGGGSGGLDLSDSELAVFTAGTLVIGDAVNGTGDVIIDSWDLSTKSHAVEIYGNDITVQDTDAGVNYAINMGAGNILLQARDSDTTLTPADAGRITISGNITRNHNSDAWFRLYADEGIHINGGTIRQNDPNLDADNDPATNPARLNIVLNSNRDEQTDGGRIVLHGGHLFSNGGTIALVGGNTDNGAHGGVAGDGISDGLALGKYDGSTIYSETGIYMTTSGNTISSGAGNIYMFGEGETGASVNNVTGIRQHRGTIQTTTGDIIIYALGGSGLPSGGMGYYQSGSNSIIETVTGNIDLTATSGQNVSGMMIDNGIIRSTGEGANIGSIRLKITNRDLEMRNSAQFYSKDANIFIEAPTFTVGNFAGPASIGNAQMAGNIELKVNTFNTTAGKWEGQTSGNFTILPVTSTRDITVGSSVGQLALRDDVLSAITAGTLIIGDAVNGTGDITVTTWDLSAKTHHVQLFGNDITLGGINTGAGNVYMYAKDGTITATADSNSNGAGNLYLLGGRDVAINEDLVNAGIGSINIFAGWDSASGITTNALFNLDSVNLTATARDITLGANGRVSSGGAGTSVLLVASDDIINNASAGASAIAASAGRYLAYATHPDETMKGGLTASNLYGRTYAAYKPSAIGGTDSYFVFGYSPPVTPAPNTSTTGNLPDVTPVINHYANVDKTETVASTTQSKEAKKDQSENGKAKTMTCLLQDATSGSCLIN